MLILNTKAIEKMLKDLDLKLSITIIGPGFLYHMSFEHKLSTLL